MGRRGPAPKPTKLNELADSWRAKQNPDEPAPQPGVPECPVRLSKAAKAIWSEVVQIIAPGVLTKDAGQTLARYCHGLVRWWKIADWMEQNEDTYAIVDQLGNTRVVRHPNVITYEKLGRDLLRMEQEFGLTPSARTRVSAKVIKEDGPKNKGRFFPSGPAMRIA
jgi:P27 family predicted phage terminase small subunit